MSEDKSVNQKCMENILCHLTKLAVLTEPGDIGDLKKLVKMSTSVSAQLLGVCKYENSIKIDDCEDNNEEKFYEMTSEEIEKYINENNGELSDDEFSHIMNNLQIDHLKYDYDNARWQMWDNEGKCFEFNKI